MCHFDINESKNQNYEELLQYSAQFVEVNSYPELRLWKTQLAK